MCIVKIFSTSIQNLDWYFKIEWPIESLVLLIYKMLVCYAVVVNYYLHIGTLGNRKLGQTSFLISLSHSTEITDSKWIEVMSFASGHGVFIKLFCSYWRTWWFVVKCFFNSRTISYNFNLSLMNETNGSLMLVETNDWIICFSLF